jgi:hypothetical protein
MPLGGSERDLGRQIDNFLLEMLLTTALREEPGAACQAVLLVLVGQLNPVVNLYYRVCQDTP